MECDGEPLTGMTLPKRCTFEEVIFDNIWSHSDSDLCTDLLTANCNQFISVHNCTYAVNLVKPQPVCKIYHQSDCLTTVGFAVTLTFDLKL